MLFNIRIFTRRYKRLPKRQVYLRFFPAGHKVYQYFPIFAPMSTENIMRVIESKRIDRKMHKTTLCSKAEISTTYYNDLLAGRYSANFVVIKGLLSALGLKLAVVDAELGFI